MCRFLDFLYSLDERRKATILRYVGNSDEVAFPSHIVADDETFEVVALGEKLFLNPNQKIKVCWLPNGLCNISNCAFANTIIEHLYVRKDTPSADAIAKTQYAYTSLSLSLNKKEVVLLLDVDHRQEMHFMPTIANEIGAEYEYCVDDEEIATCTKEGLVRAKKKGCTTIRLCKKGCHEFYDSCIVKVEEPSISIYPSHLSINLRYGREKRVAVVIGPEECKQNKVIFHSSNEKVATVDQAGVISGKSPGCTLITASTKIGNMIIGDTCSLLCEKFGTKDVLQILSKEAKKFPICPDEVTLSLEMEDHYQLQIKEKHVQKQKRNLLWSVGDEEIAEVNKDGVVEAKSPGTTYVKAELEDFVGWCKVTVV